VQADKRRSGMLRLRLGSANILGNSMYVKGRARKTKQQGAMWYRVEMGLIYSSVVFCVVVKCVLCRIVFCAL